VSTRTRRPWGLTRMKRFPATAVLSSGEIVLDPASQTGKWSGADGSEVPEMARHKRSETSKETKTKTSLDGNGNRDEGNDQEGDTD
jgi:putative ATP-grasp target RiPP